MIHPKNNKLVKHLKTTCKVLSLSRKVKHHQQHWHMPSTNEKSENAKKTRSLLGFRVLGFRVAYWYAMV